MCSPVDDESVYHAIARETDLPARGLCGGWPSWRMRQAGSMWLWLRRAECQFVWLAPGESMLTFTTQLVILPEKAYEVRVQQIRSQLLIRATEPAVKDVPTEGHQSAERGNHAPWYSTPW
jgi:hypothetical protein